MILGLGSNIKKLRVESALSQSEFADKMFVSQQAVNKWENEDSIPQLDRLLDICSFFDTSLSSVCYDDSYCDMKIVEIDITCELVDVIENVKGCEQNDKIADFVLNQLCTRFLQSDGRYVAKFLVNNKEYDLWRSINAFDSDYDFVDFYKIIEKNRYRNLIIKSNN